MERYRFAVNLEEGDQFHHGENKELLTVHDKRFDWVFSTLDGSQEDSVTLLCTSGSRPAGTWLTVTLPENEVVRFYRR